jgi:hypothetical protein
MLWNLLDLIKLGRVQIKYGADPRVQFGAWPGTAVGHRELGVCLLSRAEIERCHTNFLHIAVTVSIDPALMEIEGVDDKLNR